MVEQPLSLHQRGPGVGGISTPWVLLAGNTGWQGSYIVIHLPIVTSIIQDEGHRPECDLSDAGILIDHLSFILITLVSAKSDGLLAG